MENLTLHIEYLLLRHDCVVVPGVGAFINVYVPPTFDAATGNLSPMKNEVRFNSALRSDDGLLANSFARKHRISYREGSELMSRACSQLMNTLHADGEANIGNLGILKMNNEGNISFHPLRTAEQLAEDLGFSSINIANLTAPKASTTETSYICKEEESETPTVNAEQEMMARHADKIRKMNFDRNYYIPVNKLFSKVCACIVIVIAVAFAALNPVTDSRRTEERASVLPIDKIIDTAIQQKTVDTEKICAPETIANDSAINLESSDDDAYFLIVATFNNCSDADLFIEQNSNKGYKLSKISSKKLCRVYAKSSLDKTSLISELNSQSFKQTFSGAWIWHK